MTQKKKIGILTSGGDCGGLNAVIRAVTHRAILGYDYEVIGIRDGIYGLMQRPLSTQKLTLQDVGNTMLRQGGTILGTINYGDPFKFPMDNGEMKDRSDEVIEGYKSLGLDAMIVMGGDGSFRVLRKLAEKGGINLIAIPKTIDNDLGATETSIGYHTAVEVATEAMDRLQPTGASHHRIMVLEVMGRDAGHIALNSGIAAGADIILIPEIKYTFDHIINKIRKIREDHKRTYILVIVAEAVKTEDGKPFEKLYPDGRKRYGGIGHYIGEEIMERTKIDTRVTVLGHVPRGAPPTAQDRLLAQSFGVYAVDLIAQNKFDRMVVWKNRQIVDVAISEGVSSYNKVDADSPAVKTARGLGICLGDE